jgi:hypothetical protein
MIDELLGVAFLAWPLTLFVLIVLASVVSISAFVFFAARSGRGKWRWALVGFLVVYLPIFWDWIPTVVAHKYYCEKEAGFWVYKTVDQWKAENPGVMETLIEDNRAPEGISPSWPLEHRSDMNIAHINQRFGMIYKNHLASDDDDELFLHVWRWKYELYDKETGEILSRKVDFSTGNGFLGGEAPMKFWLQRSHCSRGPADSQRQHEFVRRFKGVKN